MKLTLVAGARPNFMKIAPIIKAIDRANNSKNKIQYRLVHTGQHYDDKLSKVFFEELGIPAPDANLGAGSGTQAEQTAKIMIEFEKDLLLNPVDLVVVVGDVTSTMACAIVAKKLNTKVAHVEAGIRSFDLTMPEEINRMVTDAITDYFFTTTEIANKNLRHAGVSEDKLFLVGNTMIDTLTSYLPKSKQPDVWREKNLKEKNYFIVTLHRPSNVDDIDKLSSLVHEIDSASGIPIIFPIHPRTKKNFEKISYTPENFILSDPLSYLEFLYLLQHAKGVITDSGGVQEETTVLGIPCITLRNNTERPETVEEGTNEIIGDNVALLKKSIAQIKNGEWKKGTIPFLWDGQTADRIVNILKDL